MKIEKRPFQASDLAHMDFWGKNGNWLTFAAMHEKCEPNTTFWIDGRPVASGGLAVLFSGVAEAWLYLSKGAGAHVVLEVRKQLEEWMRDYALWRVQAITEYLWRDSRRFLEFLGMEYEGRLRKHHPLGIDMALYARIR